MDLNALVGSRIREYRESRNVTQNDLGRHLGHTDVYISQIETGKRRIGLDLLDKIAHVLDLSPLIFFQDANPTELDTDSGGALTRRVDQLQTLTEELVHSVKDLNERRRRASEPDPVTAAIAFVSQTLDPPVRLLLLEIARAIQANPTALDARLPESTPSGGVHSS